MLQDPNTHYKALQRMIPNPNTHYEALQRMIRDPNTHYKALQSMIPSVFRDFVKNGGFFGCFVVSFLDYRGT